MSTSEGQTQGAFELRAFIDSVLTIAWSALPDGSLDFINQRFRDYTGLSSDQLIGWEWKSVVHPEDLPRLQIWWQDVRQFEKAGTTEKRLRRFDGAYRWFRIAAAPVHDEQANLIRWCGINTDIDDLKRTEEGLRASERSWRQIVDCVPGFVCTATAAGEPEFFNRQFLDYLGKTVEELRNWTTIDAIHPDDLPPSITDFRHSIETGQPWHHVQRLRRVDGVYRWFQSRGLPQRDADGGIIRWFGLLTDIEDQKRAEEKVRQSEADLRAITDTIRHPIVVLAAEGEVLYANRVALDYYGLTMAEVKSGEFLMRACHPDDVERVLDKRNVGLSKGVPFDSEARILLKNGQYRWQLIQYNPLKEESGKIIRWYATATDIDDRKKTEERLRNENFVLREDMDRSSMFEDIVGSSEPLGKVLHKLRKVAASDSTVLILGETGTGKELIARAIHRQSSRSARAFIAVNCAAMPPSLIASELFGHEKGAFTGATERRIGRFEAANGGTIFLDEVGDLPAEVQISLLRVLQEREVERIGSNKPIPVDVRVLAATHRDLERLVSEAKFRQDLLYRLNVVPVEMPSLRERAADIPLLVEYFIARFGKKAGKKFRAIDKHSLKLLQAYGWPGNVRELQNVIERAVILSDEDTFAVDETWLKKENSTLPDVTAPLHGALLEQEREIIEAALAVSHGRVAGPAGAAAKLGVPARTLDSKIKRLGIDKYRFKSHAA